MHSRTRLAKGNPWFLIILVSVVCLVFYVGILRKERDYLEQQCSLEHSVKIETGDGQNRIVRTIDRDSVTKNAPKGPVGMESQKEGADVKVDDVVSSDTYIVYRCKKMGCGGMADRLRGMINVYLLSLLTGRKFGIIHSTPCKLTEYLQPNTLDWTIDEKSLEGKSSENHNFLEKKKLPSNDMATYFKKEVVYIVSNADMTNYIRRDKGVPKILPWLNQLTTADIYKFVLDRLFKPSDMMKQKIDKFQAEVGNRKLICAHYRMGKNPSMPYDLVRNPSSQKDLLNFLSKYDNDEHAFFVASDSDDARKTAKDKFPSRMLNTPGKTIHVDRIKDDSSCSGFRKAMLEHLILSRCDTLLITESGYGRTAAFIRGTSENLFCLQSTGVFPCSRHILPEIFPGANNKDAWVPILKY